MSQTQAARLFRHFFDREPREDEIVAVATDEPDDALVIGALDGISYISETDELPLFHQFKKSDRPLLLVSSDGRQIYILKGGYRFTEKGFIG